MRIGGSLVLIAIGAILKFAVTTSVTGVSLATVGVVLMVVGLAGLVISLVLAFTSRRVDVVPQTVRVENVEPLRSEERRS